jgi:predicted nucleotidyltransferase component of viral defense system
MKKESLAYLFFRCRKPGIDPTVIQQDVCQKILLSKISDSDVLRGKVIFKGGVFLSLLTSGKRGYTKDIDLDLIDQRLDESHLREFFEALGHSALYRFVSIAIVSGSYREIRLSDYHGARVLLSFSDQSRCF